MMSSPYSFIRRNGLSLVLPGLMLIFWTAQFLAGRAEKNKERNEEGKPALSIVQYSRSGHFIQATFENWQSEFLAVASIVLLSIWLRQKGSPESKPVDAPYSQTGS